MARGQQVVPSAVDAAQQSMAKSAPAPTHGSTPSSSASAAAAHAPLQSKWSLLLDGDLRGLVAGSLAATLAAVAVKHSVCVWSSDGAAPECSSVEIHVTGEARNVTAAKLDIAEALVASCADDIPLPPVAQVKEPLPPLPAAMPYQSAAYVDWSQAATPSWAPWTSSVAMAPTMTMTMAQPSALVPQQYMLDYSSYGMASQDMMYPAFQQGGNTADMQLVHYTQQIPHSLVGLVIGVKGASIHAVEVASQCHLSLDRGCVFTDPETSVQYVLLHIHGMRSGAMQAIAMTSQILQRHVGAMQNAPSYLLAIADAAEAPPSVEAAQVVEQPDSEAMRQDIMRALFADSMESEKPAPPRQAVATPLPVLPTSLSPQTAPETPGSFMRQAHRRRRLSAPSPSESPL